MILLYVHLKDTANQAKKSPFLRFTILHWPFLGLRAGENCGKLLMKSLSNQFFINAIVLMFRTLNVHFRKFHNYDSIITIYFTEDDLDLSLV